MKDNLLLLQLLAACIAVLSFGGCSGVSVSGHRELSMPALVASGIMARTGTERQLPSVTLLLGSGRLMAEIASTPSQAATGLAFRTSIPPDSAMLFTYPAPHRVVFHMKNTYIPLSTAFIDSAGIILEIHELEPGVKTPVVSMSAAVRFVLEVNRGWFEKHGAAVGSRISFEP